MGFVQGGIGKAMKEKQLDAVSRIRVAVAFYDEIFLLQAHISAVRQKIARPPRRASGRPDSASIEG